MNCLSAMSTTLELPPRPVTPPAPVPATPARPRLAPAARPPFQRGPRAVLRNRLTWGRLCCAALLLAAGMWVCRDAWAEVFTYAANNEEYSHIFVVPFVAALLVYVRRLRLRHFQIVGTLAGPFIAGAGLSLMFAGYQTGKAAFMHSGSVMAALGCVVSVLGKNAIFRFLPAVIVLGFLVPVPVEWRQEIALKLQRYTTSIAHVLLGSMGFENTVAGMTLSMNGRPVQIAEACNGMRSVFMLLLLGFAFAFGYPLRNSVRLLLLAAGPIVALACNVVRTIPTILMYGYAPDWFADPKTGTWLADQFHWVAGYAMYAGSFLLWLGIIWVLRWAMLPIQRYTLASQ